MAEPPRPQPTSSLIVTMRWPRHLTGIRQALPWLQLDGRPTHPTWGQSLTLPVRPGRHRIECAVRYLWWYGGQSLEVDVAPGQSVPVYYSAPVFPGGSGRMGFTEQSHPGLMILIGGIIVLAALLALLMVSVVIEAVGIIQ